MTRFSHVFRVKLLINLFIHLQNVLMEREFQTTFFQDFTIADMYGENWVRDTYKRAFEGRKNNVKYFTELVVALNRKIWQHYETNEKLARVYDELRRHADEYACEHFTGEDASYYYRQTD